MPRFSPELTSLASPKIDAIPHSREVTCLVSLVLVCKDSSLEGMRGLVLGASREVTAVGGSRSATWWSLCPVIALNFRIFVVVGLRSSGTTGDADIEGLCMITVEQRPGLVDNQLSWNLATTM